MTLAAMLHLWSEQKAVATLFVRRKRLFVIVSITWTERFSNGLLAAAAPFFYKELSLTPTKMGTMLTVSRTLLLAAAPLYGYITDTLGTYFTIITASSLCTIGCLIRGFANNFATLVVAAAFMGLGGPHLAPLTSAHISRETTVSERPLMLSSYAVQGVVLRILGQCLYVPWDTLLYMVGFERLARFRITISVCSFGCFFGVVNLMYHGNVLDRVAPPKCRVDSNDCEAEVERGISTDARVNTAANRDVWFSSDGDTGVLLLLFVLCGLVSFSDALVQLVWPLYLSAHYTWTETHYSPLLLISMISSAILTAFVPRLYQRFGAAIIVKTVGCAIAILLGSIFALGQMGGSLAITLHISCTLLCIALMTAFDIILRACGSSLLPSARQGSFFSVLNMVSAVGVITSGVIGSRSFEASSELSSAWSIFLRGGAGPCSCVAPILFVASVALSRSLGDSSRAKRVDSEVSSEMEFMVVGSHPH